MEETPNNNQAVQPQSSVHTVLAHSYLIYFLILIIGVVLDMSFSDKIFANAIMLPTGFLMLILATMVIVWSQNTSRNLDKGNITKESFCRGPYCYTRTPTHWGLFLLVLGFGFILNALFVIILTIVSFVITKLFFLKEQEAILAQKYGEPYLEYKKEVRF